MLNLIPECDDEVLLDEAIEEMLKIAQLNVDAGFTINIDHLYELVEAGMSITTFNILVKNLNCEFQKQINSVAIISGVGCSSSTVH